MKDEVYCGALFSSAYLEHSYKGSEWKKHLYIKKKDGRYYYPENYYKNGLRARQKRVTDNGVGVHKRKDDTKGILGAIAVANNPAHGLFPVMDDAMWINATNDMTPPSNKDFAKDLNEGTVPKDKRRVQKLVRTSPERRLDYEVNYLGNPSSMDYAINLYDLRRRRRKRNV